MAEPASHRPDDPSTPHAARRGPDAARRWLRRRLPIMGWIRGSDADSLRADLIAGLTVAAMLVPQGMAYATLAGMPPVTGLYASTVPLAVYALLGTSGQLAVGPVAIVSLLTASTLAPLAEGDPGTYVALAGLLALMVGGIQILLGALRAGRLTTLLSHPVVSGFTSAAAIVIATSQLDKLIGASIGSPDGWLERIAAITANVGATHLPTLALGLVAIATLVLGRRLGGRVPTALLVVVLATVAVPVLGLESLGVDVLGEIPGGLPAPGLPAGVTDAVISLLPGAVIISLLSYLEGISVARAIAARTHDRIAPDQELIATGAANLAAGVFQAFPVAGGFSRTAVNHTAGARTPLASIVTALGVLLALILLAPLFTTLPEVVLAAVVLVAVSTLVNVREAVHVWKVERTDGVALAITFLATLGLGVEVGIGVGIGASLLLSLWRVGVPRLTVTGATDDVTIHVEGELMPASAARLREAVETVLARLDDVPADSPRLRLELSGVPAADASGVSTLGTIATACHAAGVELHLAGVRRGVLDPMRRAGLDERFADRLAPHPDPASRGPRPAAARAAATHPDDTPHDLDETPPTLDDTASRVRDTTPVPGNAPPDHDRTRPPRRP